MTHVEASISASDAHSRRNANLSLPEARRIFRDMLKIAMSAGWRFARAAMRVRLPLRGPDRPAAVIDMAGSTSIRASTKSPWPIPPAWRTHGRSRRSARPWSKLPAANRSSCICTTRKQGPGQCTVRDAGGGSPFRRYLRRYGRLSVHKRCHRNIATEDVVVMLDQMESAAASMRPGSPRSALAGGLSRPALFGKMHRLLARMTSVFCEDGCRF